MWDFLFEYNIKDCGQWFLFLILSVYYFRCNNFFAVLAQWKVLSFDLKVSICFDLEHPWMDLMYWEFSVCKNLLCGFLVIEVFVLVFCFVAQNQKQKHTKRIFCGHFNEKLLVWFWDAQKWICCFLYQWD